MKCVEQDLIGKIEQFIEEFEQSDIHPNRLIINTQYLEVMKNKFPSLFDGDFFISKRFGSIGVITTEEEYLGLGLAYDEFNIIKYNNFFVN